MKRLFGVVLSAFAAAVLLPVSPAAQAAADVPVHGTSFKA